MFKPLKAVLLITAMLLHVLAFAQETWYGFYMQGNKVGYVSYKTSTEPDNPKVQVRQSHMVFDASMLGQPMKIDVQTWTWLDEFGRITSLRQLTNSSGRINDVTATVSGETIKATMVTNGDKTEKTIKLPPGAKLLDDPMAELADKPLPTGLKYDAYVFSADSLDIQKITVSVFGKATTILNGKEVEAYKVQVLDPRANLDLYFSSKGDFLKATGPLGMEYRPEPKSVAMDLTTSGTTGDLALASSVPITGTIPNNAKSVTYQVTGVTLENLPLDTTQSLARTASGLRLTITPNKSPNKSSTIKQAGSGKEEWTKPDIRVPSDSQEFKKLAASIIKDQRQVYAAGQLLRKYVFNLMRPNAGIGVMRDASEILDSKEGVCRDYAVLLGTLTRSAGIPTRFVSGLVYTGQDFLYHAWIEIYDGSNWIALDATRPDEFITPGHIKTSQGTIGQGITGFLLDGAKFEVVSSNRP